MQWEPKPIPEFKSEKEERRFWREHSAWLYGPEAVKRAIRLSPGREGRVPDRLPWYLRWLWFRYPFYDDLLFPPEAREAPPETLDEGIEHVYRAASADRQAALEDAREMSAEAPGNAHRHAQYGLLL